MYRGQTVSLVLPAYNEADNITNAVKSFRRLRIFDEILVIDNNSTDHTAGLARSSGAKVISESRQGYGFALRRGLSCAQGGLIVLSEPDGTFFPADALRLLALSEKSDLVLGSRTSQPFIQAGANMGYFLRTGNFVLAKITQFLYHTPPLSDCGCTFRVISRRTVRKILSGLTVGGSHFLPEMTVITALEGFKIIEIPVHYGPRTGISKITGSKIRSLIVGLKMARVIFSRRYTR
jgi:glycosyltransferase involved in cell wall biosynthesis